MFFLVDFKVYDPLFKDLHFIFNFCYSYIGKFLKTGSLFDFLQLENFLEKFSTLKTQF